MSKAEHNYSPEQMEIYRRLFQHINKSWYMVPESEDMLRMVMYRFTPQEAEFLIGFPLTAKSLDDIAAIKGMHRDKLAVRLDELSKRGLLYRYSRNDTVYYYLQDLFSVWRTYGWPGPGGDDKHEVAAFQHQAFPDFISPYTNVTEKGLRVIPIEQTIEDPRAILPYEAVSRMLDSYTYFCVTHCGCREKKNLREDQPDCRFPVENCLHFDKLAHYIVENGLGREITKEEAQKILKEAAELGLVHGISNQQMGTDTICNCCKCCCMWFETMYRCNHSGTLSPSNYHIAVDQGTCSGCGLCVKRCPMDALSLVEYPYSKGRQTTVKDEKGREKVLTNKAGQVSTADTALCIGCGVCAYKCPTHSLTLQRNEVIHHPPKTGRDWMIQFTIESGRLPEK